MILLLQILYIYNKNTFEYFMMNTEFHYSITAIHLPN